MFEFIHKKKEQPTYSSVSLQIRSYATSNRESPEWQLELIVDGQTLSVDEFDHLDLDCFEAAIDTPGRHLVWNCSCGTPACAGIYEAVKSTPQGELVRWELLDHQRDHRFRRADLRTVLRRARLSMQKLSEIDWKLPT